MKQKKQQQQNNNNSNHNHNDSNCGDATFGILLGTLGRQGNPAIVQRIQNMLHEHGHKRSFIMLLSELSPKKLSLMHKQVDVWIQVACPRLSIDWGHALGGGTTNGGNGMNGNFTNNKPVLTPYELSVLLKETTWKDVYPMDFYSRDGGPWSNYHPSNVHRTYNKNNNNQNNNNKDNDTTTTTTTTTATILVK